MVQSIVHQMPGGLSSTTHNLVRIILNPHVDAEELLPALLALGSLAGADAPDKAHVHSYRAVSRDACSSPQVGLLHSQFLILFLFILRPFSGTLTLFKVVGLVEDPWQTKWSQLDSVSLKLCARPQSALTN